MRFVPLSEVARVKGGNISTWRKRCVNGEIPGAHQFGEHGIWMVPRPFVYGYGRTPEEEIAEPEPFTSDGERTIVLAYDDGDDRYGVYIDEEWHSAQAALGILGYLEKNRKWLEEKATENIRKSLEGSSNIGYIPLDQRPPEKAWQTIKEHIERGEAKLLYNDGVYSVKFSTIDDQSEIPLVNAKYHDAIGLYDSRKFPKLGE